MGWTTWWAASSPHKFDTPVKFLMTQSKLYGGKLFVKVVLLEDIETFRKRQIQKAKVEKNIN